MAKNNLVTQQGAPVNNAAENLGKGTPLTHAELDNNFFSIYVATNGTAEASKALIVDASRNIGNLATVTATTLTDGTATITSGDLSGLGAATFASEGAAVQTTTTLAIDWTTGNKQEETLNGTNNITTINMTDPAGPCNLLIKLTQAAGAAVSATGWTSLGAGSIYWAGGTEPTLTATVNAVDIITFYFDGTDYYGAALQNFS